MPPVCMSACRLTACDLPARVPAAYFPGACLPACLRVCHLSSCHLTSSCLCPAAHPLAACSVPILPPVTLNPITKRHACAGSPLLASSIPILLAPHADLALLQANSIKTMHPRPDPPPSCLHKTSKYTLVACLSFACLSVRLSPDCLRTACPHSCRLSSWYLSSCNKTKERFLGKKSHPLRMISCCLSP